MRESIPSIFLLSNCIVCHIFDSKYKNEITFSGMNIQKKSHFWQFVNRTLCNSRDYFKTRRKRDKYLDDFVRGSNCPTHSFVSSDGKPHAVNKVLACDSYQYHLLCLWWISPQGEDIKWITLRKTFLSWTGPEC